MKGLWVIVLVAAAAAAVGVDGALVNATGWERSDLMRIDWDAGYTMEQLKGGAHMRADSSRLINGNRLRKISKGRYVASVWRYINGFYYFTCTGSVVDKKIVLTAAHCMVKSGPYGVCVSAVDLNAGECFQVTHSKIPGKYFSSTEHSHDIALVKVDGNLLAAPSKAKIVTIDLARNEVQPFGRRGYVFGFGSNNEADTINSPYLNRVDVRWKRFSNCVIDPNIKAKNFVCIDGNYDGSRGGICSGDSGGPLVWSKDGSRKPGRHVLVGVASFGYPDPVLGSDSCDVHKPAGYAWTASFEHTVFLRSAIKALKGKFREYKP